MHSVMMQVGERDRRGYALASYPRPEAATAAMASYWYKGPGVADVRQCDMCRDDGW